MLSHCAVDLGDMMNLTEMEQRLVELRSHASLLKIVRAVTWDNYSFQHMNMANYGSARTVRSRTRIMQEYLDYPLLVEVQEDLTKRATGRGRLSNLELRDLLFSELRDLHHYHAHLLRNILSCVPSATHLTIPAFIMPILLREWPYLPTKSSAIQSELRAIIDEGKSISDIIKESQHVQFVGLPNAFILPWGEDAGAEQHDVQRRMGIEIYRKLTEDNFSTEFFWPSRRLGLHCVLEPINPDCKAEWWLRFLESAISSGRLSNLHITVGATKASLPIGPPSLGLRPTRDYFTQPAHLHFCKEFSNLNLRGITYLELKLLTICPAFFTNVKKNHAGINGVWKITSAPQLCSHWVNLQRNAPDQLAGDLAVIDQIMDDGRIPDGNLNIEISLAYDTARLPVGSLRTLELYPLKGKIIYKCCPVKLHGLPVEYPCRVDFTTEMFSSELRGLHERRKEDGFGLFNLLDELAGVDLKRIKGGIQSYLAR
ncbi:hypothetical protein BJX68DRAFT_269929 [Aspergillus pseudodeflectus]|uniref:Uncharacterized protein n=1 Tax=Aspergillus pseudodeflectus TaxID=176178 RepID=A0ABR4JUP7_9EURO